MIEVKCKLKWKHSLLPYLGSLNTQAKLVLMQCTCTNYEEITLVEQSSAHSVFNKCKLNGWMTHGLDMWPTFLGSERVIPHSSAAII